MKDFMKSTLLTTTILLVSTAFLSGCNDKDADSAGSKEATTPAGKHDKKLNAHGSNEVAFSGHVVYHAFEGGFYTIVTDSGEELNPTDSLPHSFKVAGLGVIGKYKSTGGVSIFMRGKMVIVQSITRKNTGG